MAANNSSKSMRILVANGVNLDLLGNREIEHYGSFTLKDLEKYLVGQAPAISAAAGVASINLEFFQTNDETQFLQKMTGSWDGALINAGAWTHTSVAIADRMAAISLPFIEVHISNIARRESFRQRSYLASHACGIVSGLGIDSYTTALFAILRSLS